MSKPNKEIVQGVFDQVVNQKRIDLWNEYISEDYVIHAVPYIGMGLSTQTSNDKMIISSIAPGAPAKGKLQVCDEIICIEHENHVWDTFLQLKTAVAGLSQTSTTIEMHVVRGAYSSAYHSAKLWRNGTSQIKSVYYNNLDTKSKHLDP